MRIILALIFLLCSSPQLFGFGIEGRSFLDYPAAPTLIYPSGDKVYLSGEGSLEFRWRIDDLIDIDSYTFRLYKGYGCTEANLVFKEILSGDTISFKIPASSFAEGQVYTWVLYRTVLGGKKSDRAFTSFCVIKKDSRPTNSKE